MNPKQRAAEAALQFIHSDMLVGLGTGSTADYFIDALAAHLRQGALQGIRGVPTSMQSERRALERGIPLVPLEAGRPDVTVDGADEVSDDLQLIKGLGGALLREKIVAQNSQRLIIIADASKRVAKLGVRSPLPVEVVPFAHETHIPFLTSLGCIPQLRKAPEGIPFRTDNGNLIYDCRFPDGLNDPAALQTALRARAGLVETGLFLGLARIALIADDQQVVQLTRP